MFKFAAVILLASYACAASLPPCTNTGTGLETPPVPSHCHRPPIVAQEVPQLPNQSSCHCTEEKKPVCGTDGKTYSNQCSLNCLKAKNPALKKDHDGKCTIVGQKVPQLPNTSLCQCTEEKKPVCGTDGKTYSNQCSLNCQKAKNPALKKDHDGKCTIVTQQVPQLPNTSLCQCTEEIKPVCGTDGKTYSNQCSLNCQKAKNPALKKDHDGKCTIVAQQVPQLPNQSSCHCTEEKKPVCGSDGKTYPNQCSLNCERTKNPALKKNHDGQCTIVAQKVPQLPNQSPCTCTKDMKPVCGTDDVTYNNICLLKCAANTKPVEKKSDGPCPAAKGVKPSRPNCACPHNHQVTCGSDGHTYSNECELKCVSNDKPGLMKAHDGPCKVPQTNGKS